MALTLGTTPLNKMYLGSTAINKVYLGATVVFSGGSFDPTSLFAASQQGLLYEAFDISTLFQLSDGTTAVTVATDPIGYAGDKSGRGNNAIQATTARRPTYQTSPARMALDKIDDRLSVTVPVGGFTGTMVLGTDQGTASYGVTIPAGAYDIGGRGGLYFPGTAIVGQVIRDGALSDGEAAATEAYFVANGATASYGAVADFGAYWQGWAELTSFPLIDTSLGTTFSRAWRNCTGLTSFPLIDTSSGTDFTNTWMGCNGLTSFPLIDTSAGTSFPNTWRDCTGLTSFPLIDTSLGTTFSRAWYNCPGLTSFPLIDTSSGTNFHFTWWKCTGLTSFPLIDTSAGTNFTSAWMECTGLTSFPLIDTSAGTDFESAWYNCIGLTSFPLIDTSSGTFFTGAWRKCTGLTSFPLIDTSAGTNFTSAWMECTGLTSFPLIDTSSGTSFINTWRSCNGLTSFPLIDTSAGTNFNRAWYSCTGLTSFPANAFDDILGGNFTDAFTNTALTQTSIDNILVSLVASGIAAGTRVFDQSGGSAPSATGEAAITTLRARGWTVTVTGGF